jgi:hypothetical protein
VDKTDENPFDGRPNDQIVAITVILFLLWPILKLARWADGGVSYFIKKIFLRIFYSLIVSSFSFYGPFCS